MLMLMLSGQPAHQRGRMLLSPSVGRKLAEATRLVNPPSVFSRETACPLTIQPRTSAAYRPAMARTLRQASSARSPGLSVRGTAAPRTSSW